jgi:16S rRNA (adenine1518-N6/adenine1519-N6)-dimethyltransferase
MKMKTRSGRPKGRGARLGQHFLVNPIVARTVAEGAEIARGVRVLEIGPGTGALTSALLALGAEVTAIEKDVALVARLKVTFAGEIARGQLKLIEADVRDVDPETLFTGPYVLAANIPYYITGEIIRRFLTTSRKPQTMSLLIQKEVADRIVARDHKESLLSLSVKAFGTPRVLRRVPPGNFAPPPSVDSAVLQISNISGQFFTDIDESRFFELIRAGFSSKRKLLSRNLRNVVVNPPAAFTACGIAENARAEDVPLEAWQKLALVSARG